jgi:hypothetical protein
MPWFEGALSHFHFTTNSRRMLEDLFISNANIEYSQPFEWPDTQPGDEDERGIPTFQHARGESEAK